MNNECPITNPFDIRNHKEYPKLLEFWETKIEKCRREKRQIIDLCNKRLQKKKKQLSKDQKKSEKENDRLLKLIKKLQRQLLKKLQTGNYDFRKDPKFEEYMRQVEKKNQAKIAAARAEVEQHWSKKMHRGESSESQEIKRLQQQVKNLQEQINNKRNKHCPDIVDTPEYQRLMAKYEECQDRKMPKCPAATGKKKKKRCLLDVADLSSELTGAPKVSTPKCTPKRRHRPKLPKPATMAESGGMLVDNVEAMKRQIARSYIR